VSQRTSGEPVLFVTPSRHYGRSSHFIPRRIDVVRDACRPMAEYLFNEALGTCPSGSLLHAAKRALLPLRGHPGLIGWAVMILLEGGETKTDYEQAITIVLRAARGARDPAVVGSNAQSEEHGSAPVVVLARRSPHTQLVFPGFDG
jgi:hypothetical protein